jgi:hypothetical protein
MQSCTVVLDRDNPMAWGNPFSPSTQAMKMSFNPRFCISVSTCLMGPVIFEPAEMLVFGKT